MDKIRTNIINKARTSFSDDDFFIKEAEFASQAFYKNDRLCKAALDNPKSAIDAIKNISAMGLTLNPSEKLAYLVPRNGGVCLDISYIGLLKKAKDSGCIRMAVANIVREKDEFIIHGLSEQPTHIYKPFGTIDSRGPIVGAYCSFKLNDSDWYTQTMPVEEINKIKSISKSSSSKYSPWGEFEDQMMIKTVIKRGVKYIPGSEKISPMVEYMNKVSGEGINFNDIKSINNEIENKDSVIMIDNKSKIDSFNSMILEAENNDELIYIGNEIKSQQFNADEKKGLEISYKQKQKQLEG